jgi:hypothetical protein
MIKVEWGLEGQTNVDQVADKTKKGLDGIEKNAKRVGDAFGMSMSSIFLRFLGPMALLQAAISWVSTAIDESKQKAKEAMDLAVKGESMAVKAETSYLARKYASEDQTKKEEDLAKEADVATTQRYIEENGTKVMNKMGVSGWLKYGLARTGYAAQQEDVQQAVRELAAEEMKNGGTSALAPKGTDFKSPEGFSNVVGVGASPVLEAMTAQLEETRRQTELLDQIASQAAGSDTDFTKDPLEGVYIP